MEKDEYEWWIHIFDDRITPEIQKLFDEYEKRFGPLYNHLDMDDCISIGYEKLTKKVKTCLEKDMDLIHLIHLETPDMEKDEADEENKIWASWYHKYLDRITPEVQKLLDEYEKKFGHLPCFSEELSNCVSMGYEELIEKVKICLEKNINLVDLEIPDYVELIKHGFYFG